MKIITKILLTIVFLLVSEDVSVVLIRELLIEAMGLEPWIEVLLGEILEAVKIIVILGENYEEK